MSKTHLYAIQFANFCSEHNIKPYKAIEFIQLIETYANVEVRLCNEQDLKGTLKKRSNKLYEELKKQTKELGFDAVDFPGLYPILIKNGYEYHPPLTK